MIDAIHNQFTFKGRYQIKVLDSVTGELKRTSPWIQNQVMSNNNNGVRVFIQYLLNNKVNPITITSAKIGSGSTTPTVDDTDLEAPVTSNIPIARKANVGGTTAQFEFFITDASLPDGTYNEFGIFMGAIIFARSIISPAFTKATGEDTQITYEVAVSVV